MFTKIIENIFGITKNETPQNPPGSQDCRTCAGTGQALFKDIKSGKLSEDTCQDCQGKGHVFKFTKSVYEI